MIRSRVTFVGAVLVLLVSLGTACERPGSGVDASTAPGGPSAAAVAGALDSEAMRDGVA